MSHTAAHEEMKEHAALYALGALGPGDARAFEAHLSAGCEACAAEMREFELVVAQLALASPPVEPPAGVREKLLSRVAAERHASGGASEDALESRPPAGASDFLVVRGAEGEWAETSDPGVSFKVLFVDGERDTLTRLVRLEPGARIPPHLHLGVEQCLVVEGSIRAGQTLLRAGDFNCAMKGSVHEEISTDDGALLLIVAPENYLELGEQRQQAPPV